MLLFIKFQIMRQFLFTLHFVLFLHFITNAQSQQNRPLQNRDTLLIRTNRVIQHELKLTDEQSKKLFIAQQRQMVCLDSLNTRKDLSIEERGNEFKQINKTFKIQLKSILTNAQFVQYKKQEDNRKMNLAARAKSKKIIVKDVEQ